MSSRAVAALVSATLFAGSVWAANDDPLPRRRPGLWTQVVEFTHRAGQSTKLQQCVDTQSDPGALRRSLSGDERVACSVRATRRIAGGVEMDMGCSGPDGAYTAVTRVVGDMSSSYRVESQMRYDLTRAGTPRDVRMVIRGSYAGACPASAQNGEVRRVAQPGQDVDPAALDRMSPLERKRALDAAGRPERH